MSVSASSLYERASHCIKCWNSLPPLTRLQGEPARGCSGARGRLGRVLQLVGGAVARPGDGQDDPRRRDGRPGRPPVQVDPRGLLQVHAEGEGQVHREGHSPQGAGHLLRYEGFSPRLFVEHKVAQVGSKSDAKQTGPLLTQK